MIVILVMIGDPKEAMKRYLHDIPILPTPPAMITITRCKDYFEPPKSRRQLLAEERAEEEARELSQARLASRLLMEKLQKEMERGRNAVFKKYVDDGEESDGSDVLGEYRYNISLIHS